MRFDGGGGGTGGGTGGDASTGGKATSTDTGGDASTGGCGTSGSTGGGTGAVYTGGDAGGSAASTARSVGLVMLLSTLARCLSLVGNMRYTSFFGYTLETDIYTYAVNLPNLIFTCIGTALVTVVIPIFAGRAASRETGKAYRFVDNIVTFSSVAAAAIAAAGIAAAPLIVGMVRKFAAGDPSLALFALRLMFPVVLFHAVGSILQGVLQTNGRFLLPAVVSAFSGLAVIAYVSFFAGRFGIRGLLVATFIGLAAQAVVLIPPVRLRLGYKYRPALDFRDGDVRLAGKLALPVLVSSSSYQLNMFMNSTFAAGFDGGVITITNMLTLAFTAAQLFIISALSVYFPKMSARYATGDTRGFYGTFAAVVRLILVFAVPASVALAYLSKLLIPLLYGRGKVTGADMASSSAVFAIYAGAIASIGLKEAADRAFYAVRDSKTPAAVSVVIMALNVSLSLLLKGKIGIVGLPAAYFASISAGAALLLALLNKKLKLAAGGARWAELRPLVMKCAASTLIMLAALALADLLTDMAFGGAGQAVLAGQGIQAGQAAQAMLAAGQAGYLSQAGATILRSGYGMGLPEQAARLAILTLAGGGAYAAAAQILGLGIFGKFKAS